MPIQTPICDFGQKAHDFKLKSTDNKIISLNDVKGENGTLIMFICNHCPYVKAVTKDIVEDCKKLKDLGVNLPNIRSIPKHDISVADFDEKNISNWYMPKDYYELDVKAFLLEKCTTQEEKDRVEALGRSQAPEYKCVFATCLIQSSRTTSKLIYCRFSLCIPSGS